MQLDSSFQGGSWCGFVCTRVSTEKAWKLRSQLLALPVPEGWD